jgi:hypothetical protein
VNWSFETRLGRRAARLLVVLPLIALSEADRGAVVAWVYARLVERSKRIGAAA